MIISFLFRTGEIEEEAVAHEGGKASRAIYLKNGNRNGISQLMIITLDRLFEFCDLCRWKGPRIRPNSNIPSRRGQAMQI